MLSIDNQAEGMMPKDHSHSPDLAEQLRQAIRGSGKSLNRLAEASGVHKAQLSRFLRAERTLTLTAAARLCTCLGLHLAGSTLTEDK
jgi:plasmid maintenance system antidote protein VapI